jgi:hypothetical protein
LPSLVSLACRARLNCQPSTELTHQSTTSLHFTSLHFTSLHFTSLHFTSLHWISWGPRYTRVASGWTQQTVPPPAIPLFLWAAA